MQWVIPVLILAFLVLVYHRIHRVEDHLAEHLDRQTHHLEEKMMSESQDTVDALTAQVTKAKGEVLTKIDELEAQVANGEAPDFTALREAVQGVDDIVPDAPVEPTPEPEAPADPAA